MLYDLDNFYSDAPVKEYAHDAFERDVFASRMASVLHSMGAQSDSSVAALVGPWGSGKSSVLNLLELSMAGSDPKWEIRRFNPWLFADIESLLLNFFDELTGAFPVDQKGEARKKVGEYAKKLAPLGKVGGFFGADLEDVARRFGEFLSGDNSAEDRRGDVVAELDRLDFRVLIVMDDVDRLQPDELLTVLKLIRLIGDLPNVHYLLAYDERTLLDVLMGTPIGNENESRAAQYVDKMVQVRFDLPPLTDYQQDSIFTDGMRRSFEAANVEILDTDFQRLASFFDEKMRATLRVPRRINKYFAQLAAFLTPEIAQEVDVIDFCVLTFIRTFEGPLYYELPGWKSELLGNGKDSREFFAAGKTDLDGLRERWILRIAATGLEGVAQLDALDLLGHLFPVIRQFAEPYTVSGNAGKDRIQSRRISTAEYFDRFFQFAVPANDVSDALVSSALDCLVGGDDAGSSASDTVSARLTADPDIVLPKLWALVRGRPCPAPRPLVSLLCEVYVPLAAHPRRFAIRSPQDLIRYIMKHVLTAIPASIQQDELEYYARTMDLVFLVDVAQLLHEDGFIPPWSITFRSILTERSKEEIDSRYPSLANVDHNDFLFFKSWGQLDPDGEARSFARDRILDGHWDIEDYLRLLTGSNYMLGVSDPRPHLAELEEESIDYFLGIEFTISTLASRLDESIEPIKQEELVDPSPDVRLRHALIALQRIKQRLVKEQAIG